MNKKIDFINICSTNNKSDYGDDNVGRGGVDDGVITITIIITIFGIL
jgi:hypothetical protein